MIKEILRKPLVIRMRASHLGYLVLALLTTSQSACIHRPQIYANLWNSAPLPVELCDKYPEIKPYGFYRKLNNGKFEVMPYCSPLSENWLAIYKDDLEKLLNEAAVPK